MTTTEKRTALNMIINTQQQIEALEAECLKAYKSGETEKTKSLDREIDQLLNKRRGIEMALKALNINIDRKDYRIVEKNGDWSVHTNWYLA
jgi:hypothetical protein